MLEELNRQFAIEERLRFVQHSCGLIQAVVETPLCQAAMFLLGSHVSHFQATAAEPLLFMSEQAILEPGVPIRGGVPICFPWFGPYKARPNEAASQTSDQPAHGWARTAIWSVVGSELSAAGDVVLTTELTAEQWRLEYRVRCGASLGLSLKIENLHQSSQSCEAALHSYFNVADVHSVRIHGLESQPFLDKLSGDCHPGSGQAIRFEAETDRVYSGVPQKIVLEQLGPDGSTVVHQTTLTPRSSRSTVVWNPWIEKSKRMSDFGDQEYLRMCCIETANVAENAIQLGSGETAEMSVDIQ